MAVRIIEPPAIEPVSLAAAKLYLRVDHDAEDALIAEIVRVAREAVEVFTGRALITRRIVETRDGWAPHGDAARLVLAPVVVVHAVRVVGATGAMTALSETPRLEPDAGLVWLLAHPIPALPIAGIEIEYDAGYGEAAEGCPAALRQAVLVTAAALYETRDGGGELPAAARALAAPFARVKL